MKKVAATRGHRVRRTNFFRLGTARGWGRSSCVRGALAVANFYGFLLKATHSHHRVSLETPCCSRLPRGCVFPGISVELVRNSEITGNFHRCNSFFVPFFEKFCKAEGHALPVYTFRDVPRMA